MENNQETPLGAVACSALCPVCGRRVRTCIPSGGDGSADVYVRHKDKSGERCDGSRSIVEEPPGESRRRKPKSKTMSNPNQEMQNPLQPVAALTPPACSAASHSPDCDVNDKNPDGIEKPCNCGEGRKCAVTQCLSHAVCELAFDGEWFPICQIHSINRIMLRTNSMSGWKVSWAAVTRIIFKWRSTAGMTPQGITRRSATAGAKLNQLIPMPNNQDNIEPPANAVRSGDVLCDGAEKCYYCGGVDHDDTPCPKRSADADRFAVSGRREYPPTRGRIAWNSDTA